MATSRKRIFTVMFLIACALLGFIAVKSAHAAPAPTKVQVVEAADWTPADGFREGGKCYENIAFAGPMEVSCSKWHPVPAPVRQCAAAAFIAGISAYFTGNPVGPASSSTVAGCFAAIF